MLVCADARSIPLADESIDCVVTSPPYWGLRDYKTPGQLGLEATPEEYVEKMVSVFREVRRVLKPRGTCWVNMGDCYNAYNGNRGIVSPYAGKRNEMEPHFPSGRGLMTGDLKPKDLVGMPWRLAFALQADGWWLRSDIIWAKPNPMPESVTDRPTKAHEYVFLLAKNARYHYDQEAVREVASSINRKSFRGDGAYTGGRSFDNSGGGNSSWNKGPGRHDGNEGRYHREAEGAPERSNRRLRGLNDERVPGRDGPASGRNMRTVWTTPTQPYKGAHFATFPEDLVRRCILAGCPPAGIVLDPFCGTGTVVKVAREIGCEGIGVDRSMAYLSGQAAHRIKTDRGLVFLS